jgi:hypothetical protein
MYHACILRVMVLTTTSIQETVNREMRKVREDRHFMWQKRVITMKLIISRIVVLAFCGGLQV